MTYYSVCLGYLIAIAISALVIEDLTFIFGIVAAISESMLNFILPAMLVLLGRGIPAFRKAIVACFALAGLTYFLSSNYFNFLKIARQANP